MYYFELLNLFLIPFMIQTHTHSNTRTFYKEIRNARCIYTESNINDSIMRDIKIKIRPCERVKLLLVFLLFLYAVNVPFESCLFRFLMSDAQ